jgi:protein tyrosine phosphatase (PTP) superfamily phosphohydrolase (DUF442 family)
MMKIAMQTSARIRALATLLFIAWATLAAPANAWAATDPAKITNYREYSPTLSSAGQPERGQFEALREAGFERVIFLAFTDHHESIANEDRIVTELGMEYVQIPVVWEQPTRADFAAFTAVMRQEPGRKTLVHCQVNYRASAFVFLYRVLFDDVPMDQAKEAMESVWVPNDTWRAFIFSTLEANGRSPHCDLCLWDED